jgi:hypothetical protein
MHKQVFTAASLVLLAGVVHADTTDSAQMRNLENRVNALEQRKGAGGMINPQGRPQVRDGADLFIFGDLLYWNAHQNGMNVAVVQDDGASNPVNGTNTTALDNSQVINLRGKWNWGFRAGLGYNAMHDGWDLQLTWLRYTDTSHKLRSDSDDAFYPTQTMASLASPGNQNQFASKVRGYWGFNLNQLDLDLGREFFVSKWLTLRPHVGLRTDWIHQHFNNSYYNLTASEEHFDQPDMLVKMKDHWYGIGLQGGLDTQWGLGNGWSVFGNAAGSILYGFHQLTTQNINADLPSMHDAVTFADVYNSYHISHAVLDFAMGLRWDEMFCNDRFHIRFDLGWEHHVYFSQNQFPLFVDDNNPGIFASNQGDLTLQGWTFATRFDF